MVKRIIGNPTTTPFNPNILKLNGISFVEGYEDEIYRYQGECVDGQWIPILYKIIGATNPNKESGGLDENGEIIFTPTFGNFNEYYLYAVTYNETLAIYNGSSSVTQIKLGYDGIYIRRGHRNSMPGLDDVWSSWTSLESANIDLSDYYTKDEINFQFDNNKLIIRGTFNANNEFSCTTPIVFEDIFNAYYEGKRIQLYCDSKEGNIKLIFECTYVSSSALVFTSKHDDYGDCTLSYYPTPNMWFMTYHRHFEVVNNLSTPSPDDALSAKQGVVLNETKADKTAHITFTNGETLILSDNTEYIASGAISTLTIEYPDNEFLCTLEFTTASTGDITITLPESKYIGNPPVFANGETWEINIRNGVVIGGMAV